jgi:3-isopropylmalate/(R)-2-methylmalate dehydratase small subunit
VDRLIEETRKDPEAQITVDLETRTVEGPGVSESFEMDDFTRHRLLNGLDDIGLTLTYEDELEKFEQSRPAYKPTVL